MVLDEENIRKRIAENGKADVINRAAYHQQRLKFHAAVRLTPELCRPQYDFFAFVDNILPHDKAKLFKALFRYPVATNEVTAVCFDKLSRIFDGRNPVYSYQFTDNELQQDWEDYRRDVLGEPGSWSKQGWEYFKTEINSVLVVDMPQEQQPGDPLPRPYFYWLPVCDLLSFEAHPDTGAMHWLAFRQPGDRIAVIDGGSYRIFAARDGNIGELLSESPHDLGYCPARFFWDEPISLAMPDVKASPLTRELEALDWYLFYGTSKRHLDLYGSYPIYSGYAQDCDFSNAENGDYCDGGFLKNRQGQYKLDLAGELLPCPKCGNRRIIGAGSFVEVPVPKEGQPDMSNPVQVLQVDRGGLDYNVAELERLRTAIITAVVGTNEEITTRDALNEQQIRANFESQTTVLNRIKRGFERAQQFVDDTVCKLRYGTAFISSTVNYGTDFYIYDPAELRERYSKAKAAGSSEAELDALQKRIIDTEYRTDPLQRRRMMTLADLEPYRHLTRSEAISLYDKGLMSEADLLVKLDFAGLIRRFERENADILEFGSAIDYDKKINIIKEKLREYVSENERRENGGHAAVGTDGRELPRAQGGGGSVPLPRGGEKIQR